jgi:hypothetical protein
MKRLGKWSVRYARPFGWEIVKIDGRWWLARLSPRAGELDRAARAAPGEAPVNGA